MTQPTDAQPGDDADRADARRDFRRTLEDLGPDPVLQARLDAQPGVRTYRRLPVDVEAVQVTEENAREVAGWMNAEDMSVFVYFKADIHQFAWNDDERSWKADPGDWVVRDERFMSFGAEEFQQRYQDCAFPPGQTDEAVEALFQQVCQISAEGTASEALYEQANNVGQTLLWLRGQGARPIPEQPA